MKPSRILPFVLILLLSAPVLFFHYLPMTDLPQHAAIASIIKNHDTASFGYDSYYSIQLNSSPYFLVYGIIILFSFFTTITKAAGIAVFIGIFMLLFSFLMLLDAMKKPWYLIAAVFPFIYSQAFFWGFINFIYSISFAFFTIFLLIRENVKLKHLLASFLLSLLSIMTHIYGLLIVSGFSIFLFIFSERKQFLRIFPMVVPVFLGVFVWSLAFKNANDLGGYRFPPFYERFISIPSYLSGRYFDHSEVILAGIGIIILFIVSFDIIRKPIMSFREMNSYEKSFFLLFLFNVLMYFTLPEWTPTAKYVHFRHLIIAFYLPVLFSRWTLITPLNRKYILLLSSAFAATIIIIWSHLFAFDRECDDFSHVVSKVPNNSRLIYMGIDPHGSVFKTYPYIHFGAWVQAENGGLLAMTLPQIFWNLPVRLRNDAGIPDTPLSFEWRPDYFSYKLFGYFYDYVLVRSDSTLSLDPSPDFPFVHVFSTGTWYLYKKQ